MSVNKRSVLSTSVLGFLIISCIGVCCKKSRIEVYDIRINTDKKYLDTEVIIHNRSQFDVNVTIHRDLVGHNLFMSIHLKAKIGAKYVSIQRWKKIELCRFLSGDRRDPILSYMFDNALKQTSELVCPLKAGTILIKDAYLDASKAPPFIPRSRYRFFLEISQMIGDAVKMLSMKIEAGFTKY